MELSLSTNAWRYALLTINILQATINVAFFCSSVLIWSSVASSSGVYMATTFGLFVMVTGLIGCVVSMRDSYTQFMVFAGVCVAMVVIHFIFVMSYALMLGDVMDRLNRRIEETWANELAHPGAMGILEVAFKCCGLKGPEDYLKYGDHALPDTCCYKFNCVDSRNLYVRGCAEAAPSFVDDLKPMFYWSSLALMIVDALGAYLSYNLTKKFKDYVEKDTDIIITET